MGTTLNVSLAIFIPILLIGAAFGLGIIEFSPQNTNAFLQSMDKVKQEIIDLTQGKRTIEESLEKVQSTLGDTTQKSSKSVENVVKYAKKTVIPSSDEDAKQEFDTFEIEKLVHELTNQQRKIHGLSELSFDLEISEISRAHSSDMATRDYFSHETPEGLDPTGRAKNAGYSCTKIIGMMIYSGIAENIFQGHLFDSYYTVNGVITSYDWSSNEEIAQVTVDGWMDSPGHRKNILTEMFDREGIGVVISEDEKVYITQNFC